MGTGTGDHDDSVGRHDSHQQQQQHHQLFTGDLDSAALAAERAELDRLVACMEETLEDNEVDMQYEQDEFSAAAKMTTGTDSGNGDMVHIESIAMLLFNETTAKMLHDQQEEFNSQQIDMPSEDQGRNHEKAVKEQGEKQARDHDDEDGSDHAGGVDDLSIDESVNSQKSASSSSDSSSSSSSKASFNGEKSKADAAAADDDDDHSLHSSSLGRGRGGGPLRTTGSSSSRHSSRSSRQGSSASLSIFEIQQGDEYNAENESLWIQNGILRVDESSEQQAFICDWQRFRKWKKRKLQSSTRQDDLESSSQRWADRSAQDSGLRIPRRRTSDSTHGTRSTATNSKNNNNNNNINKDGDNIPVNEVTVFDWKAWRRRKDGHVSSTSCTNSFSVSDNMELHDDDFDANSVLAKLDEWDFMEATNSNNVSHHGNECHDSPIDNTATGGGTLHRANSEVFASKRTTLPVRSNSDKSIHVDETKDSVGGGDDANLQWKDWRREQRKIRLGGSWSHLSAQLSPGSDHGAANDELPGGGAEESETGLDAPVLLCQSPVGRTQSETAPATDRSPKEPVARSNSFVLRRTFHQSPLRSPRQKSALQQSPIGAEWKKWQREKRRTGIWKRTFSDRDSWGLPFHDDKADSHGNSRQDHSGNKGGDGSCKREQLTKSQSDRWDATSAGSGKRGEEKRKGQLRRAHSVPPSKEREKNRGWDWKTSEKDQGMPGTMRSPSDRWSTSTAEPGEHDKPPTPPSFKNGLRRSQSEKWDNRKSNKSPDNGSQSGHHHSKSNAPGIFDWKSWKKDKRKSMRKANSEMLMIGPATN